MDSNEHKNKEDSKQENDSNHNQKDELKEKKKMDEETQKEIEKDLKRVMEELKKQQSNKRKKGKRPRVFAIEFGGVYHHNRIVNFLFSFLFNMTLVFALLELLQYATYDSLWTLLGVVLTFTVIESAFRLYVFSQHFKLILQSFGTVFYFGYVMIFYMIDQFVFTQSFNFINELVLVFFVLIFSIARYGFGLLIRRFIRHGWK